MDPPPSPLVRVERTFWTVWNYITDVVGRLLRPVATDIGNNDNDTSSSLENTADRQADTDSHSYRELEVRVGGEDGEQNTFATGPVVDSLSRPSVAWEQPITEPEKENVQFAAESSRGGNSHMLEESEDSRDKQVSQIDETVSEGFPVDPNEGTTEDNIIMPPNNIDTELNEDTAKFPMCSGNEDLINTEIIADDKHELDEVRMHVQADGRKETEQTLHEDQSKDSKHTYFVSWMAEGKTGDISTSKDIMPQEERDMGRQSKDEAEVKTDEMGVEEELERSGSVLELIADSPSAKNEMCFTPDEGIKGAGGGDVKEPPLISEGMLFDDAAVIRAPANVDPDVEIQGDSEMYDKSRIVLGGEISVVGYQQMVEESIERSEMYKKQDQGKTDEEGIVGIRKQEIKIEDEIKDEIQSNKILHSEIEQEYCSKALGIDDNNGYTHKHAITEDVDSESKPLPRTVFAEGDRSDKTDVFERETNTDNFEQSVDILGVAEFVNLENIGDKGLPMGTMSIDIEIDKTEEERLSSEEETVSYVEEILSPVPVKLDGISTEEINQGLKDISPGICVGPVVMPLEPEVVACDITQEEVPDHNNGLEVDEDTTQRILELADFQDNWTTQLPEKAESHNPESSEALRNVVGRLLVRELEEEQSANLDSGEHTGGSLDMFVEQQDEARGLTDTESPKESEKTFADQVTDTMAQVPWPSFLPEAELLDASMKADPRQSESAFEPAVVTTHDTQLTELVPSDDDKELLVGGTAESTTPEVGETSQMEVGPLIDIDEKTTVIEEEMTELSTEAVDSSEMQNFNENLFSIDSVETGENRHQEDFINKAKLMEQFLHIETTFLADKEPQDKESKVQEEMEGISDIKTEEKAVENESDNENNNTLHPLALQNAAELSREAEGIENVWIVTSEPSEDHAELSVGSEEIKRGLTEKPLEVSNEENVTAIESLDKLVDTETEPRDTVNQSKGTEENTGRPDIGHGNDMDEEILDMGIEAVLAKETDDLEPKILVEFTERDLVEEPVHALQRDIETPTSDEELSDEFEKEQSVKSHTEDEPITESALVGEVEVSETSASEELVFFDQSTGELGPSEIEGQKLEQIHSETSQGTHETAGHISEVTEMVTSRSPAEPSEPDGGSIDQTSEAGHSYVEEDQFNYTTHTQLIDTSVSLSEGENNDNVDESSDNTDPIKVESAETRFEIQKEISPEISASKLSDQHDKIEADGTEAKPINMAGSLLKDVIIAIKEEPLDNTLCTTPDEMQETVSALSSGKEETESLFFREGCEGEALSGETVVRDEYGLFVEPVVQSQDQLQDDKGLSLDEAGEQTVETDGLSSGLKTVSEQGLVGVTPRTQSEDHPQVSAPALDFTHQKSRIAVKNPYVRPPTDPRGLLHMPSLEPTPPQPSAHPPVKHLAGVPMGGVGIGIKLPGFGAGFPVLKKTQRGPRDGKDTESISQKADTETERTDESPKQEQEQPNQKKKPKWMPPRLPGFGNPLMAELKNKLKKTADE